MGPYTLEKVNIYLTRGAVTLGSGVVLGVCVNGLVGNETVWTTRSLR